MDGYRVYTTQMASVNNKYISATVLKRDFFYLGEGAAFTIQIVVDYIDNMMQVLISIITL